MAAVDITVAEAEVIGQIAAVVSVGLVVLMVYVALSAFRTIRDAFFGGGGEVDHWAGYTAADDARDRAAAGLPANPNWLESAREYAMQLQLTGEGQSQAYADGEHAAGRQMEKEYEMRAMVESRTTESMDAEEARYREMWAEQAEGR